MDIMLMAYVFTYRTVLNNNVSIAKCLFSTMFYYRKSIFMALQYKYENNIIACNCYLNFKQSHDYNLHTLNNLCENVFPFMGTYECLINSSSSM